MIKIKRNWRSFLVFAMIVASLGCVGAETKYSKAQLVDEFVHGLLEARKFDEVQHLFLTMDDFEGLVAELKKSDMPARSKKQLESAFGLKQQKREMRRSIVKPNIKKWESLVKLIRAGKVRVTYNNSFDAKDISRRNLKTIQIKLSFTVKKRKRSREVKRIIKVVPIQGKLKIIELFRRI